MQKVAPTLRIAVLLLVASLVGCANDFAEYSVVDGFRLLAIAADRPALAPGEQTTVSALVTTKAPDDKVSYRWSWCPYTTGAAGGFRCAVTEAELAQALSALSDGAAPAVRYDLGREPTATIAHAIPPSALKAACAALRARQIPGFTEPPDCEEHLEITVRLEVSDPSGARIDGVKTIDLRYEAAGADVAESPNENPRLTELTIGRDGVFALVASDDEPPALKRDTSVDLRVAVASDASQPYRTRPPDGSGAESRDESLTFSWFVEAGSIDDDRTGFLPGERSLADAVKNTWTTPRRTDFAADHVRLYVVLRDNRGGVSWIARRVRLED